MNPTLRNILLTAARWLLGGVFLFSGLTKSVDAVGTSVFVEKYLATYGLEVLLPAALGIAIVLAVVEMALGIMLIVGIFRRYVALTTSVFLALFTIITLLSATVLPIGDCGCFGDAVKLTPWQTFLKNILLLPVAVALWCYSERRATRWQTAAIVSVLAVVIPLGINLYSLRYLPIVDFLPYKEGVNLREEITRERERMAASVQSILIFNNTTTGKTEEYPSDATECWLNPDLEYVDARTVTATAEAGDFADFSIFDTDGEDYTLELLNLKGRVAWLCINDASALEGRRREGVDALFDAYPSDAIVVVTSSNIDDVAKVLNHRVYTIDAMTLRSFIRAKVGVVVLNDGVIETKLDIRDIR